MLEESKNSELSQIKISPFVEDKKIEPEHNSILKTLRTYKGDVEDTIGTKKESIVSIVAAEEKAVTKNQVVIPVKRPNFFTSSIFMLVGVALLLVGAFTFIVTMVVRNQNASIVVVTDSTPIPYTEKKEVTLNLSPRDEIISYFNTQISDFKQPVNSVLYTAFKDQNAPIDSNTFFHYISQTGGESLARSIEGIYMSGIYSYDTNEVFFIFNTEDFGATYSGMLQWEKTMKKDLTDFFPHIKSSTFLLQNTPFTDETFKNHDVRVIRNANNEIVLLYGFIDKKTLVITANEKVFEGILNKFINAKLVR